MIVSEQLALYSGRPRWGWQSARWGDSWPLHRLGRKQEPQRTVCFTTCGWSRPVLFFRGWGWRDLVFGVQASTSGLEVRPRCEDGSQVSPLRPLEDTGLAEGDLAPSRLATLLCSPLWPGGAEAKPRVPCGKGREAALFCCPEAAPVPPDRAPTLVGSRESRGRGQLMGPQAPQVPQLPQSKPQAPALGPRPPPKTGRGPGTGQAMPKPRSPALATSVRNSWAGLAQAVVEIGVGIRQPRVQRGGRVGCVSVRGESCENHAAPGARGAAAPGGKCGPVPCPRSCGLLAHGGARFSAGGHFPII